LNTDLLYLNIKIKTWIESKQFMLGAKSLFRGLMQ